METKDLNDELFNAILSPDPRYEGDVGRVMFTTKHFFEYFLEQGIDMRDVYIPIMFMAMCRFFYESQDLEKAKQEIQGFMQDAQSNEFNNRMREAKEEYPFQQDFFSLYISEGNKTLQ